MTEGEDSRHANDGAVYLLPPSMSVPKPPSDNVTDNTMASIPDQINIAVPICGYR